MLAMWAMWAMWAIWAMWATKQAATEEIPESVTSGHRAAGWRKEQKPAGNWKKHKILEFLAKGVRDPFGFSGKG